MAEYEDIRTGRHCVFVLHVHLVFVTKYRHQVFAVKHLERMEEIMQAVCADFGAQLREFNGEADHIHLLVDFPPTIAISRLVNSLKGVSSRRLRQEFPDLRQHYWRAKRLWSGSYFAGSVGGAPISVLRQYVEQQNRSCLPVHAWPPTPSEGRRTGGHFGSGRKARPRLGRHLIRGHVPAH
jgi:putative transposase